MTDPHLLQIVVDSREQKPFAFHGRPVAVTVAALRSGRYVGALNPLAAWQSVIAMATRYRVPFFWCNGRDDAEAVTWDILRHYARERWRELRALRGNREA